MGDNKSAQQPDVNEQIKVRMEKLKNLQDAGKDPFQITKYDVTHHTDEIRAIYEAHEKELLGDRPAVNTEGLDEQQAREAVNADYNERRAIMDASPINVSFAGRMMFKRVMGKASFCNIADLKGRMQAYISRDAIGEEAYADFKKSDIGDIFGIKGFIFRTKTGEISVHAEEITLLSKSLQVLPEKFHGITDTDMRYRQRYVDLIMNPEVKDTFVKRSKIIKEIRKFLDGRDFMEVETPTLVSNAGGAAARPFETHYNALDEDVKLRISLELYLKRLIVGGLERVYEIGRVYRNEGVDTRHNPEFTLMELYQAYTDYEGMMELTESMFRHLAETVCGTTKITYNGTEIDLGKPFRRLTMNDAIKEYAGVDFDTIKTDEEAKALAKERGIEFEERHTKGDIINLFFEEYCEEKLIQPTFIMDHPLAISPLTKKKPSDPEKVERFELFINTWEMCNAYSELNDPIDQRERFAQQDKNAENGDEEAQHTDEDFLNALAVGMPPTGGIGYGIDGYCCEVGDALREKSGKPVNYTAIAIKGLLFHYHPTNAIITVDGVAHRYNKVWLAPTMNGRFYGGGMMPTPDQKRFSEDKKVSTMLFFGSGKLKTLYVFPSIFKGEHIKHPEMCTVLTGKEIQVEFDRPTALQIDGETVLGVTGYTVNACDTPAAASAAEESSEAV